MDPGAVVGHSGVRLVAERFRVGDQITKIDLDQKITILKDHFCVCSGTTGTSAASADLRAG